MSTRHWLVFARVALATTLLATSAGLAAEPPAPPVPTLSAAVGAIVTAARADMGAYSKLIELCDDIGHRLSGSPQYDLASQWAVAALHKDGILNAHLQPTLVPKWVRGQESLQLVAPRPMPMTLLGLGGSIATPKEGITAQVLVVRDLADLKARADQAKGKIVLFNQPMPAYTKENRSGYGEAVQQRVHGGKWAHEHGALAALVRSVTARSLNTPHTGGANFDGKGTAVPTAAIATEHAELLARFAARGIATTVTLKMDAHFAAPVTQNNVVAEIKGSQFPNEVVVIGGHLDSWDVGQGAHDDGAGVVMAMQALTLLKNLGYSPKRTIRAVLFANEENGLAGGRAYALASKAQTHVAALEADSGAFAPTGLGVEPKEPKDMDALAARAEKILAILRPHFGDLSVFKGHGGADISPLRDLGVPAFGLVVEGSKYFDYHHTPADTVDKVDPKELADCAGYMAALAWIMAQTSGGASL